MIDNRILSIQNMIAHYNGEINMICYRTEWRHQTGSHITEEQERSINEALYKNISFRNNLIDILYKLIENSES